MPLTVKQLEAAKFGQVQERLSDGNGLYLRLYPSGKKAFQVQVSTHTGRRQRVWVSFGDFPNLGLRQARETATWVRMQVARGWSADQVRAALRSDQRDARTPPADEPARSEAHFRDVARLWFERKRGGLKNGKHITQNWTTIETYALPTLGHRPICQIERREVVEALRPIWHEKHETAMRTLARIREIFELAKLEYDLPHSPADFDPAIAYGRARRVRGHFGALPWERMPEFWDWLRGARCEEQTRQFVMMIALSAKRTGEVRFARPGYFADDVWTTPAEFMKMGRAHRVPLSSQAKVTLENAILLSTVPDRVFGKTTRSGVISENAALNLVKRFDPKMTGHGFRASFKGWARSQGLYQSDAIEFALAHRLPPLVEAYFREDLLEERRVLMQDWADFVTGGEVPARLGEKL